MRCNAEPHATHAFAQAGWQGVAAVLQAQALVVGGQAHRSRFAMGKGIADQVGQQDVKHAGRQVKAQRGLTAISNGMSLPCSRDACSSTTRSSSGSTASAAGAVPAALSADIAPDKAGACLSRAKASKVLTVCSRPPCGQSQSRQCQVSGCHCRPPTQPPAAR